MRTQPSPERLVALDHPAVVRMARASGETGIGVCFGIAICAEAGFDAPFDSAAAAGARLVAFPAAPSLHGRRTSQASWRDGFPWWEACGLGDARRLGRRLGLWIASCGGR